MREAELVHIVDDENPLGRSPDFMLRSAGYRVARWSNGEAFLRGADNATPACVLLNMRMPGLNALEIQARMPAANLDFPVVLMNGHGDIAMAIRAMKAGAADILERPIDQEKLLRSVEVAFNQIANRAGHRERAQRANAQLAKLNDRERDVLDALAGGYPNKTIAHGLKVSLQEVERYRNTIVMKLELRNFVEALRIAFAAGWGSERKAQPRERCGPASTTSG